MTKHLRTSLGQCFLLVMFCAAAAPAQQVANLPDAQWLHRYPKKPYYQGLEIYRDGDLKTATEAFESALAVCLRDDQGFWIDAIPVHAMLAECFYQGGDLRQSLLQIEAALSLLSRHRGWIDALNWSTAATDAFRPGEERSGWVAANAHKIWAAPERLGIRVGDVKRPRSAAEGQLLAVAGRAQVDAIEILRGAAIAGFRRRLILGELADQSSQLAQQVRQRDPDANPQSPLPRALLATVDACVRFASGQEQSVQDLESLATIEQTIHPLTPLALLAAARQAIERERFADAASLGWRAAETASLLGQPELVGEAMVLAVGCTESPTAAGRDALAVVAVSYLRRGRPAAVGALLAASEAALREDDVGAAEIMLRQAQGLLQRRDLRQPRLAAHGDYLAARLAARLGHSIGGSPATAIDESIQRLLTFARGPQEGPPSPTTPRRFQMNLAIAKARHRGADPAQAEQLLSRVTVDPPTWLWKTDPVDALAYHAQDRSPAIAAQLDLASQRDASAERLAVLSDALLRYRFLAQLPLGGRVQQVRCIASANPESLIGPAAMMRADPPAELQRLIDLLAKRRTSSARPASDGGLLESLATEIALDRAALPEAMPPPLSGEPDLARLGDDHAMLIYVDLGGRFLGLLLRADRTESWRLPPSRTLSAEVAGVLRGLGVPAVTSGSRLNDSQAWTQGVAQLRRRLIPDEHLQTLRGLRQLSVVPDGPLWYLPMELLPLEDSEGGQVKRLGDRLLIRYGPTPGLALMAAPRRPPADSIAVVGEAWLAPQDAALSESWMDQIVGASDALRRLPAQADGRSGSAESSVVAVLADVKPQAGEPLECSPIPGGAGDPLRQWLRLSGQVPRSLILPGFRTAAEGTPVGDGHELFMTLTALRCSGVEDILISRWAVAGASTAGLIRELLQELPYADMQPAWRRSVQLLRRSSLDPQREPLLTGKDAQRDQISGDHPLFWAGYLLDTPIGSDH